MSEIDALQKAHRHFSAANFNAAWDLIDLPARDAAQADAMLLTTLASLWHWTQREDVTARNASIGWWQASRVAVLCKLPDLARLSGERALAAGRQADSPFCAGYGHEALARAAAAAGETARRDEHLAAARQEAAKIEDAQERDPLLADLATIVA